MSIEQAILLVKPFIRQMRFGVIKDAYMTILSVANKEVAKPLEPFMKDDIQIGWACPSCHKQIKNGSYCKHCGQKVCDV